MGRHRVLVIGAGVGGLAAAADLANRGFHVTVLERAAAAGGKMRQVGIDGRQIDVGPTVLTMRWVFDALFEASGASLDDYVKLLPADVLARHAWVGGERLDLHRDVERTAGAIADAFGAGEAAGYRAFVTQAQRTYEVLAPSFINASRPSLPQLLARIATADPAGLLQIKPHSTLWHELGRFFRDPRLRQLFGRYATYCGSSPFQAPATLMLIAHVERLGVWLVEGGMHRLAQAIEALARQRGAQFCYEAEVCEIMSERGRVAGVRLADGSRLAGDVVVVNADAAAITAGLFGAGIASAGPPKLRRGSRSLSALTWTLVAETRGFALSHHNVFFCADSAREFDDLAQARVPREPTVYVCAQDRGASEGADCPGRERLLAIVNAPANGESAPLTDKEIEQCTNRVWEFLSRCGLQTSRRPTLMETTTPAEFESLYPGTGGAIYGRATHGAMASFMRPGARTRVRGLYLTGGSTHPGAGVPMALLSGRRAASSVMQDLASMSPWRRVAMLGGMSTR